MPMLPTVRQVFLQGWAFTIIWKFGQDMVPCADLKLSQNDNGCLLCLNCADNVFMIHTGLPSGSLEF